MSTPARASRDPVLWLEQAGNADLDRTGAAWRRYVDTGELAVESLRPHVAAAWARSIRGGCDPMRLRTDVLDEAATAELLLRERDLLPAARPFLAALSRAAGEDRHAVMLADRDCRVLEVAGDHDSVNGPDAVPGPGSLLVESVAGANGHGTALAHGGYVEIVGPEHFIEGFQAFTCQGIPLRGAGGETVGVLGISVRRLETASRVRDVLFCATEGVECQLLHDWLARRVSTAHDVSMRELAEKLRQDLVQSLSVARLGFEIAAEKRADGLPGDELLANSHVLLSEFRRRAATWRDLVDTGYDPRERLDLASIALDVVDLVRTEARIQGVEIETGGLAELLTIAPRRHLTRRVLTLLLNGLQGAGPGGALEVLARSGARRSALVVVARARSGDEAGLWELGVEASG